MKVGDPARLTVDQGRTITGSVRRVYPEVDRMTRLGKVRIRLGDDPSLRIGAFARGTVEVARREGIAVPVSSLLYGADGRASVLVAKDGKVEARTVTPGLSSDGYTEIREGVAAGERVVARAGSFLRDGDGCGRWKPPRARWRHAEGRRCASTFPPGRSASRSPPSCCSWC